MVLQDINQALQRGDVNGVKQGIQEALDSDMKPRVILNEGLLSAMETIGVKFKNNEVFVPEVLIAARAMNAGMELLKPKLVETGVEPVGTAVLGTVKGDLHDIGKNLVRMMLEGPVSPSMTLVWTSLPNSLSPQSRSMTPISLDSLPC